MQPRILLCCLGAVLGAQLQKGSTVGESGDDAAADLWPRPGLRPGPAGARRPVPAAAARPRLRSRGFRPAPPLKVPAQTPIRATGSCAPAQPSVPSCLGAGVPTVVQEHRPECNQHGEFCCRSVYTTSSGVLITLPVMTEREISHLYSTEYGGQKGIHSPTDERPVAQSSIIRETGHFGEGTSGLTIMEMGCADGWVLYNLRKLAGKGGRLVCFEADLDYAEDPARLAATFEMAKKDTEGLSTELHKSLFDPAKIAEKSVDVFTSSHVIEHLADPCTFLNGLHTVMKPGGIIFTEVPDQHMDPVQGRTRGQFHLLYFAKDSFVNMMTAAGFEQLELAPKELGTQGGTIRTVFRVPYAAAEARVPNAAAQVLNSAKARNVYLDLGANWANTLRLYRDFYPEKKNEPWEVYAFEASPFIQPYDEKFIQYLNGHGSQPPLTVPPAGSSDHLRMYAAKYGCNTEHFRECMWAAFKKPLAELKFDPQLNKTELINQRLAEAATASHGTRYTFIPAAVAAQDGVVHLGEMSAEQMIRGGAHSSGEGVHSGKQVDVYGVDVATFITKYFDKGDNVFVKMDVEGLEFAILQKLMDNGGIQIIDKLVMECHAGAGDCKKLIRSVKAAGVDLGFEGEHGYKGFDSLSSPDVYAPAAPATL